MEVLKARKERLDAARPASVVEIEIMTRNVTAILTQPATYIPSMLQLRKPALLASAQYVLFEMELEPYGGFVRDVLIREDWHPSVDLDVCAANCRDAATRFVQWLGGLGVAYIPLQPRENTFKTCKSRARILSFTCNLSIRIILKTRVPRR